MKNTGARSVESPTNKPGIISRVTMTEKYVSPVSRKTWHSDPESCPSVEMPERMLAKPESYIQNMDVEPCAHCVTGEVDRNRGKSVSNLAKSIRHGTELND